MERWKYKLEFEGKLLRELIDGDEIIENVIAIYNQVIRCLQSLKSCMIKRDLSLDCEEEKEKLNCCLSDFYDLCDNARVWIGI